ncbi:hypothetical protein V5O48_013680 [Marasmius crinis-equi]|uniref:Integrase core domain-containing protein n=1 Tax=Marasmius crinis-equi TaxID=585013 RepID=A0ABR3EZE8_9AGAR
MPTALNGIPPLNPLPVPDAANTPWSPNVLSAVQRLSTIYGNACAVLGQEADSSRLKLHHDLIADEVIPILEAMDSQADEDIPEDWILETTRLFGRLASKLAHAQSTLKNHDERHVRVPKPVKILWTGKRGRPAKVVDRNYLTEAMRPERAITIARLTRALPIHRNTLRKYIRVVAIQTSTNNRASTVLENFLHAVDNHGAPSRVRGDYGTENKLVALYMILKKGQNRGSFIWGSSTRNTRIERLWVEVGRQFARQWRAFFFRLEALHGLVRPNRSHIWLVHYLFLNSINNDCQTFQEEWNAHPILGEGHNMSPNDMRLMGMSTEGIYIDDCEALTRDEINDHYGIDRTHRQRPRNQTGAGTLSDEEFSDSESVAPGEDSSSDDSDMDELDIPLAARQVFAGLDDLMERVHVPRYPPPFSDANITLFSQALGKIEEENNIPEGCGILPEEWENGEYPSYELLRSGKKGTRELRVDMPDHIWRPRAERWVQALHTLNYMLEFVVK